MAENPTLDELVAAKVADQLAARDAQAAEEAAGLPPVGQGDPRAPKVPQVEQAPQTVEQAAALVEAMSQFRAEVAAWRAEVARERKAPTEITAVLETPEERRDKRLAEIAQHSHYCPACGNLSNYPTKCVGEGRVGQHAPVEMVSTAELGGDPANHTQADDVLAAVA